MPKILELPIGELKYALAGLSKIALTKSSLPILRHVRIEPDGNNGIYLSGTDLECFATCRIAVTNPDGFPACTVDFDALNKLVKTTRGDLALVREDDGKLNVRYSIGDAFARKPIETLPVVEWPAFPPNKNTSNPLDEAFKPAFRHALECASVDSSRFVLNGACLDVSQPDCHTVVGTDGRQLYSANTFRFPLAESVIIPDRKFLNWSGFVDDGPWRLAVEASKEVIWVRFESTRWTVVTKSIDGQYPNWRQVVPESEGKSVVRLSPEAVASILDALPCLPVWNENDMPVQLESQAGQLVLKAHPEDSDDWTHVPVAGSNTTGAPFQIKLNRKYLSKALRFGFTKFDVYSAQEPVLFTAPGRKMLISPLWTKPPETPTPAVPIIPQSTATEAVPASAPSAAGSVPTTTEAKKPMTTATTTTKEPNSPLKEAAAQIEKIKETLKAGLAECATVLTALKSAEREQKAVEKEVDGVRSTLRALQKVEI